MCNLYSMTKSREAALAYTRAMRDKTGNQPPLSAPTATACAKW
jgi:hypothetical protein